MSKTDVGWCVALGLGLLMIAEPAWRNGPLRWACMGVLGVMFAVMMVDDHRSGRLRQPLRALLRNPPKARPLEFLGSMVGLLALML